MSLITNLLQSPHTFAVVGVSQDPARYGDELFEVLIAHGHLLFPVIPKYNKIDGQDCFPSLTALPKTPDAVITPAPSSLSAKLALTCSELKMPVFWMPPGTVSDEAIEICKQNQVTAMHGF